MFLAWFYYDTKWTRALVTVRMSRGFWPCHWSRGVWSWSPWVTASLLKVRSTGEDWAERMMGVMCVCWCVQGIWIWWCLRCAGAWCLSFSSTLTSGLLDVTRVSGEVADGIRVLHGVSLSLQWSLPVWSFSRSSPGCYGSVHGLDTVWYITTNQRLKH